MPGCGISQDHLTTSNNVNVSGNLKVSGSIIGSADYIWIQDEKATGTDGGTCTAASGWQTRDLVTEKSDDGGHASLSSNQITLAAGTYRIMSSAPGYKLGHHQTRLYNVTDGSTQMTGTSEFSGPGDTTQDPSFVRGQFTLSATKTSELQYRCDTDNPDDGFGSRANLGEPEIYSVIELWRLGD